MIKVVIRAIGAAGIIAILLMVLAVAVFPRIHDLEAWVYPVKSGWKVTSAKLEGRELTISGTMIKHRNCQYIPGPRARDESAKNYFVESLSTTKNLAWIANDQPQAWGPWVIMVDADELPILEFYQQDRCHGMWDLFTVLGKFDVRTMKQVPND